MAQSDHDKRVESKVGPKLANQRQREFLSDKSIGGPDIPRPEQSFIDAAHDPKATDAEIYKQGHTDVWHEDLDKKRKAEHAEELASKMEGRRKPELEPKKESILDRLKRGAAGLKIGENIGQGKGKTGKEIGD